MAPDNRFHVPPLPDSPAAAPEPDPLLENFRDATIKGKKIRGKPHESADSVGDSSLLDMSLPDLDNVADSVDWGLDDTGSW